MLAVSVHLSVCRNILVSVHGLSTSKLLHLLFVSTFLAEKRINLMMELKAKNCLSPVEFTFSIWYCVALRSKIELVHPFSPSRKNCALHRSEDFSSTGLGKDLHLGHLSFLNLGQCRFCQREEESSLQTHFYSCCTCPDCSYLQRA